MGLFSDIPVHQPFRPQVFQIGHFKGIGLDPFLSFNEIGRQEGLRAETDQDVLFPDDVHGGRTHEGGHEGIGRPLVDLPGRAHLPNPPLAHDHNPVSQAHGLHLVVGDVDGGDPHPLLELPQFLPGRGAQEGIQIGEGFIQEEDARLPDHGPGQGDPLPLAPGELAGFAVQQSPDPEHARRPMDFLLDRGFIHPPGA